MNSSLRHNYIVNLLDGGFFGFALGFASFVTIIPLFISQFSDAAILIGLIPVLHNAGWQLPQLFTANLVAKQKRHKPLVLWFTIHERLPFLAMAGIAWFSPRIDSKFVLLATFLMLAWQGFGAGFTANSWQSMIAKLIPSNQRGTFLGMQGAALNILFSIGAIIAGFILVRLPSPLDFTACFLIASGLLVISFIALALTIENETPAEDFQPGQRAFYRNLWMILQRDRNFVWFLCGRIFTQFAMMASAFYIIYIVRHFQVNESTAGLLTGVLAGTQIVANPILGWLGDRLGHRLMLTIGAAAASLSALIALFAPGYSWFYVVFILIGISNVTVWTIAMSITMAFGGEADRPAYIGLANTLLAPAAIIAPLFGGWIADTSGYTVTFALSAISGLVTIAIFLLIMKDPQPAASTPLAANTPQG
jgi:MFS family permease